jgi:hypothetical protein
MKYIPVCFALSLAILYIVIGVPPSVFSKLACVVLGLALLYFGSRAKGSIASTSLEEGSGMVEGEESSRGADTERDAVAERQPE